MLEQISFSAITHHQNISEYSNPHTHQWTLNTSNHFWYTHILLLLCWRSCFQWFDELSFWPMFSASLLNAWLFHFSPVNTIPPSIHPEPRPGGGQSAPYSFFHVFSSSILPKAHSQVYLWAPLRNYDLLRQFSKPTPSSKFLITFTITIKIF